jgi:GT2 family glycosyltransferase
VLEPGALRAGLELLTATPRTGAVAFNVVDPESGHPALWFHPFDRNPWSQRSFEAITVIGCGHLVRRDAFEALGGFWDGYFREMEEVDLSWRLIDAGWSVQYEPRAVVRHAERTQRHTRFSVASNLKLTWRLLPLPLALRQTAFLGALFTVRAARHGEGRELLAGLRDVLSDVRRLARERAVLQPATVRYLRQAHAPQGLGKRLKWALRPLEAPEPTGGQPSLGR